MTIPANDDQLFSPTVTDYLGRTTEVQWGKIDKGYSHYFSTPSLAALLSDMENQVGVKEQPTINTQRKTLGEWIGNVTLADLTKRVTALNSKYLALAAVDPVGAWAFSIAVQKRSGDLTFLGVYLYGLGTADGLYDQDANPAS